MLETGRIVPIVLSDLLRQTRAPGEEEDAQHSRVVAVARSCCWDGLGLDGGVQRGVRVGNAGAAAVWMGAFLPMATC